MSNPVEGGSVPRSSEADLGRLRIDRDPVRGPSVRRWLVIVVPILILAGAGLFLRARAGLLPGMRVRLLETAVVLRPAVASGGRDELTANGYVQARRSAAVSAEITGRLQRLLVEEGSRVERGELIAELASSDLRARVATAQSQIGVRTAAIEEARAERTDAENELGRQKTLLERGLGTQAAFDGAQARRDVIVARIATATEQLTAAHADLDLARAELAKAQIRAPFTGTVLRKNAEVGEMVSTVSLGGSGSRGAIVTIADLDSLDVEVDVNEAYIGRLKLGQPARVTTDAYPDTSFAARVRQIVPTSDRQKATVLVKAEILAPDSRLLPDMGAKVTFLAAGTTAAASVERRGPTLADNAIQHAGAETFVWLVGPEGRIERRTVELGAGVNGRVQVAKGLVGGETVAVRAARPLRDGLKVSLPESR